MASKSQDHFVQPLPLAWDLTWFVFRRVAQPVALAPRYCSVLAPVEKLLTPEVCGQLEESIRNDLWSILIVVNWEFNMKWTEMSIFLTPNPLACFRRREVSPLDHTCNSREASDSADWDVTCVESQGQVHMGREKVQETKLELLGYQFWDTVIFFQSHIFYVRYLISLIWQFYTILLIYCRIARCFTYWIDHTSPDPLNTHALGIWTTQKWLELQRTTD